MNSPYTSESQRRVAAEIENMVKEYREAEQKHTGFSTLRDSDVLKALVFLVRLAHGRTSGRPKSRAFVDFLFAQFPEKAIGGGYRRNRQPDHPAVRTSCHGFSRIKPTFLFDRCQSVRSVASLFEVSVLFVPPAKHRAIRESSSSALDAALRGRFPPAVRVRNGANAWRDEARLTPATR